MCWERDHKLLWFNFRQVTVHSGTKADATKVSTSAVDGNIIVWDFKVCLPSIGYNTLFGRQ